MINPICVDRLKTLLSKHQTTQTQLSQMTDISMNTLSKIVNRKSPLTPYVADKIVKCFPGTRYEWLMGIDDFETELILQGYKAFKPFMEKRKREKAVSSFFHSLNLSFSPNVPETSLLGMSMDKIISKYEKGDLQKALEEYSDLIQSPNAFVIEKDGEEWGYCSEEEKNALFEEIFDFAEFSLLKLCNRGEQKNG